MFIHAYLMVLIFPMQPLKGPTLPPKGERNLQQCASDKHTKQERMMSPWNATSKQQSPSPDPPGALQPAEYEPLHIPFHGNEESRIRTGSEVGEVLIIIHYKLPW